MSDEIIPIVCAYHHNLIARFNQCYLLYWCKECRNQHFVRVADITNFPYGEAKELHAHNIAFMERPEKHGKKKKV